MVRQIVTLFCKNCNNQFDGTASYNELGQKLSIDSEYCDYCDYEIKYNNKPRTDALDELTKQAQELDMGYSVAVTPSNATIGFHDITSHYISFKNKENKEVGKLDFNGDKLVFEGDVEESAKKFMDYLLMVFENKIDKMTMEAYHRGWNKQ